MYSYNGSKANANECNIILQNPEHMTSSKSERVT